MSKITIPVDLEISVTRTPVMNAIGRALAPRFVDLGEETAEEQAPADGKREPYAPPSSGLVSTLKDKRDLARD